MMLKKNKFILNSEPPNPTAAYNDKDGITVVYRRKKCYNIQIYTEPIS